MTNPSPVAAGKQKPRERVAGASLEVLSINRPQQVGDAVRGGPI